MDHSVKTAPDLAPASPPKAGALLVMALATFLGLFVLAAVLPHDPYIRYQQLEKTLHFRTTWGYERIVFDEAPIDIAIIGNSRLGSGISAPTVSQVMSEKLGRPINVVNFSMAQEGRNSHYALAKLLYQHHPEVKLVVLSAIEEMPRQGHPAFRNIAEARDILTAPALINREFFNDLAFLPFRQLSLWLYSIAPQSFGWRQFDPAKYRGSDFDTTTSYTNPEGEFIDRRIIVAADELRAPARARISSITPAVLPPALNRYEYAVEYTYTAMIDDLVRRHGGETAFLYLPVFENPEPLRQAPFYEAKGHVFTAECLAPDAGVYWDYGHLTEAGAKRASVMLGETFARLGAGTMPIGSGISTSICPSSLLQPGNPGQGG